MRIDRVALSARPGAATVRAWLAVMSLAGASGGALASGEGIDLEALNRGKPEIARVTAVTSTAYGTGQIRQFRLGNGLGITVWEERAAPVFSYHTWFGVGSRHERPGKTGIAHLFEHLMFKATRTLGDGEFDRVMESHGAQTNAATWVDWTYYREKLPAGNLELVAKLEADRMVHLVLNPTQLESEREVVINERLLRVDNDPDGKIYEELYRLAFQVHPYGWPTIGWMADIKALTLADCMAFYKTFYAPNNAHVVVVGDIETDAVLKLVQQYYGHLEAQELPKEERLPEPPQTAERKHELRLPVASERGLMGWHAPAASDPDHVAMEVLDEALTGGESSRLHRRLVLELELASDVGGWVPAWNQPGLYELSISMRPGIALDTVMPETDRILAEVRDTPLGEREITKAKNSLEADFLRRMGDTESRARGLGNALVTVGQVDWYLHYLDDLRKVTAADVQRVARQVLVPTNRTIVHARPTGP
jgi:zinc protease